MTQDQIDSINEQHMTCMRLAKGLIVAGRKLGEKLQAVYDEVPTTTAADEDEAAWTTLVQKQFGIPPEVTLAFADFSLLPEVQNAPALPAQAMALHDALRLVVLLNPVESDVAVAA